MYQGGPDPSPRACLLRAGENSILPQIIAAGKPLPPSHRFTADWRTGDRPDHPGNTPFGIGCIFSPPST